MYPLLLFCLKQAKKINKTELKEVGSLPMGRTQRKRYMVNRNQVFESFLSVFLEKFSKRAISEFSFLGEEGSGLGPTLEFYALVCKEIQRPERKLFKTLENNSIWPDVSLGNIEKKQRVFKALGRMCGQAIVDMRILDLPLNSVFWDLVLGRHVALNDLEKIDPNLFETLSEFAKIAKEVERMKDSNEKKKEIESIKFKGASISDLFLFFVHPYNPDLEIVPGGKDIQVTIQNVGLYVKILLKFFLSDSIRLQIGAFRSGLFKVAPPHFFFF